MLYVLGLVAPLFAIIAMGRLAIGLRFVEPPAVVALNNFTFWVAMPALLFDSTAGIHAPGLFDVAFIYLICCLLVFALAMVTARVLLGASLARTAMFGLNATYGNVIFLGTPLVSAVFGPAGLSLILAIIALHSGVLLPLAALLIELGTGQQGGMAIVARNAAASLLRNPIILSIALGFLWNATGVAVPAPMHQFFALLGRPVTPLALFCLGASLPAMAGQAAVMREAALATALKLIVLPLCVGAVSWMAGLAGLPWRVAVATAAMPTGANAFLLARRTSNFAEASATTVVITTVTSVVTITGLLTWLR